MPKQDVTCGNSYWSTTQPPIIVYLAQSVYGNTDRNLSDDSIAVGLDNNIKIMHNFH